MFNPLHIDVENLKYTGIIGTGGIGSGKFFRLNKNHTLGREESRSGSFLNIRDYCKLHIILHYVKVLMGPDFPVVPIGKVGEDDTGRQLMIEMSQTGFNMNFVEQVKSVDTLFSICFYYPDGSGGNLTTDNSASAAVLAADANRALPIIKELGNKGMIMAVPEVPLEARYQLLKNGRAHGLFCSASFTPEEISNVLASGILTAVDLLAINIDEAKAVAGVEDDSITVSQIVEAAIEKLKQVNDRIQVAVTAGSNGSWCWDGNMLSNMGTIKMEVVSTAGAGDAFFAGLLCGLAAGLHLFEAQQLATMLAGLSITSPHTIHSGIDRLLLRSLLNESQINFSKKYKTIIGGLNHGSYHAHHSAI